MKCYKYSIEGYEDWMHRMDYFKGYKVFIPEPYNFSVFTLDSKIKYIKRQKEIDNYGNCINASMGKIHEIDLDIELIKKFYDLLKKEEDIAKEKDVLSKLIMNFQTDE